MAAFHKSIHKEQLQHFRAWSQHDDRSNHGVLIINLSTKDGPEKADMDKMMEFWNDQGCFVQTSHCLRELEFSQRLYEFLALKHLDFFAIVILSSTPQGQLRNTFCSSDGMSVELTDLHQYINDHMNPRLRKVPKLLLYQFYEKNLRFTIDREPSLFTLFNAVNIFLSPERSQKFRKDKRSLLSLPNTLECYATQPQDKLFGTSGSWFINSILEVFKEYAKSHDIQEMMLMVNKKFVNKIKSEGKDFKYMSSFSSTMMERFFLFGYNPSVGMDLNDSSESEEDRASLALPLPLSEQRRYERKSIVMRQRATTIKFKGTKPGESLYPTAHETMLLTIEKEDFSSILSKIRSLDDDLDFVNGKVKSLTKAIILSVLSDTEKAELFLEMSQRQSLLGSWELASQSAKMGLSLLESVKKFHIQNELLKIGLWCCAGEASRGLHKMRDFTNYLYKSQKMMEFLPEIEDPKLIEKHEQVNDIYQKMKQSVLRDEAICSRHSSCKLMDTYGGKISIADATINFSNGSLKEPTVIQSTTTPPDFNNTPGLLPVSPILKLTPTMDLHAATQVTLRTWASTDTATMETDIFYRESEEHNWEFHTSAKVDDGKVRFSIQKFCHYTIYIKFSARMNWNFQIKSRLFVDATTNKLTNRLVEDCATCIDALKEKMPKVFEPVCSGDPTLITKIGDEVQVELKNVRDDRDRGNLPIKSATISEKLLRHVDHELQDFILPRDSQGIVDFTHNITHYQNREIKDFVSHQEDRIRLGSSQPDRSVSSMAGAFNVVGEGTHIIAHGTQIVAHEGVDAHHQANG